MTKHAFGGPWTFVKLELLKRYLNFYTTAVQRQAFKRVYIDAFAGTGECEIKLPDGSVSTIEGYLMELKFLSNNGGTFRAKDTHALAKDLGIKPVHMPVCSPQSNGMVESFVNTFKRAYVSQMDRSSAALVLRQMPAAFDHFNEVHPHSALATACHACLEKS